MSLTEAILVKRMTTDGLVEVLEDVSIGKAYVVDLATRHLSAGINVVKGKRWVREIIHTVGDDEGWLPTELLDIYNG